MCYAWVCESLSVCVHGTVPMSVSVHSMCTCVSVRMCVCEAPLLLVMRPRTKQPTEDPEVWGCGCLAGFRYSDIQRVCAEGCACSAPSPGKALRAYRMPPLPVLLRGHPTLSAPCSVHACPFVTCPRGELDPGGPGRGPQGRKRGSHLRQPLSSSTMSVPSPLDHLLSPPLWGCPGPRCQQPWEPQRPACVETWSLTQLLFICTVWGKFSPLLGPLWRHLFLSLSILSLARVSLSWDELSASPWLHLWS